MNRRSWIALALVPLAACGGDAPTTPTTVETPATRCRRHATTLTSTYTLNAAGGPYESTQSETCTFDRATRVLRCAETSAGPGCTSVIRTRTYASVADFVEEAEAMGRERWDSLEIVQSGGCPSATSRHTLAFDGQRRPVRGTTNTPDFASETTFTAWDAQGRPTQGTVHYAGCSGSVEARAYDEGARTLTIRTTAPGTGSGCFSSVGVLANTYDADGNVVRETWTGGSTSFTRTIAVGSTSNVCI